MRTDWKAYFAFSKRDRNAAIVLLSLITLIILSVFFYHPSNNLSPVVITTLDEELAKRDIDTTSNADEPLAYTPSEETELTNNSVEYFPFDPNTLDAAGFRRLGLQDKTINTILKYRSKGGHFWKADDLRKIYGLRKDDADRLIPYVQLANRQATAANTGKVQPNFSKATPSKIDINTAAAEQWKSLPAIGDVLANRIIKFRDKMGGFKSVEQVKQTYGLSDSAFKAIEPYLMLTAATSAATVTLTKTTSEKININTASLNQLKNNPHIPEEVAQAIVIYRTQHGNFAAIEDVKKIVFINEELYKQIAPFLTVE